MVDISAETWNKAEVAAINIHVNDVNKTVLLLPLGDKNLYDLIDKEIKGKYGIEKLSELTKPQIRKYKIHTARLFKGSTFMKVF